MQEWYPSSQAALPQPTPSCHGQWTLGMGPVGPHSLPFLKELASGTAVWGGEDSPIPDAAAVGCGTKREMLWQLGDPPLCSVIVTYSLS